MAAAFSRTMLLDYKRVQFTPDVLPSDLTGFSIYGREEERFVYQPGSVFCNLLLADEINRTSPKTQSALLEVMEEGKVTVEGITRKVPEPFCVIATQNPSGSLGTQRLPEAQVDRFMISLSIGYPDFESELAMAKGITDRDRLDTLVPVIEKEQLLEIQKEVCGVYISEEVFRYIIELVRASRENPMEDLEHITAFILYTLQSNTVYTRTPGMFPWNEDPVEYFLFQGKKGIASILLPERY